MARPLTRVQSIAALVLLGVGWGSTQPLGKIAASSGHPPLTLILWQTVICVVVLGALTLVRGKGLVLTRRALGFYLAVAVLGTLVPNAAFYISVHRLPSGIMSILISTVPLMAFPMNLALGSDKFEMKRLLGLLMGLAGVAIIAAPGVSLAPGLVAFLPVALIGPLFYALEGTFVGRYGMAGMDPIQAMFGASLVALALCLPLVIVTGSWVSPLPPWGLCCCRHPCTPCFMRAMSGWRPRRGRCLPAKVRISSRRRACAGRCCCWGNASPPWCLWLWP